MTNPRTGVITREWEVEIITTIFASGNKAVVSSKQHPYVSEAYLLQGYQTGGGTVAAMAAATVISHDVSFPVQGTLGATQVATLGPQQFLVGFGVATSPATQLSAAWLIRGK